MLFNSFARVYVINLPRRTERLNTFFKELPRDWPFRYPEKYKALDGGVVTPPQWWNGGGGAWGCYKTHLRILEDCLNNDIPSVLILEDDAVCVKEFGKKVQEFWDHLPQDWEMVYLGGQHLYEEVRLPRKVNDWVYKPYNINRCHCYGFRGRTMMERAYRHLNNFFDWKVDHHVDHYLGELHRITEKGLYVPREWLVAQSEGKSDICGAELELRLFPGAEETVYPPITREGIALLGDYFGGTNTIAGVLYHLGVDFGIDMPVQPEQGTPWYFEDGYLVKICRNCYEEPWLTDKNLYEDRVNHLCRWAGWQCKHRPEIQMFCAKHPILSLMGPEILQAWPNPKFIIVDRPQEDSIRTLNRLKWAWHPRAVQYAQKTLKQAREDFLESYSPELLRIDFEVITDKPEQTIHSIEDFLSLTPSGEQYANALAFLKKSTSDYIETL